MQRAPSEMECRPYTPAERLADKAVHLLGLGSAALGVPLLMVYATRWHGASPITVATLIYGATLFATIGFSAAYHMAERPDLRDWLRRGDHAAIYAKIAGAYTPVVMLHGGASTGPMLTFLWVAALAGIVLKLAWPRRWDGLAVLFYVAMGWSAVLVGGPVLSGLTPTGFLLIVTAGLLYTGGIVFFLWERLPFQNAIWHAFVLTATALVFTAILIELAAAGGGSAAGLAALAPK